MKTFVKLAALTKPLAGFVRRGVHVHLLQGDMTEEETDAIVNAANERLHHGGGLAGMIVRKGGQAIQEESHAYVQRHGEVRVGTCALTGAGALKCGRIIHAVGPVWSEHSHTEARRLLRLCVENVYLAANANHFCSISLTAISSGIFGYPKNLCAADMLEQLTRSIDGCVGSLEYVRVVVHDDETVKVFRSEFAKHGGAPPQSAEKAGARVN